MSFIVKTAAFRSQRDHKQIGCAVHLSHEGNGKSASRFISYPLKEMSPMVADLLAATIGLSAICDGKRVEEVTLHASEYVVRMLRQEGGKFKVNAVNNAAEVTKLRKLSSQFPKLISTACKNSELGKVVEDAKAAAESRRGTDSGSLIVDDVSIKP